jgi:RNase adapter protein RapZ
MADRLAQLHMTVITGMSGAGKSEAVATFEDMGYFCIDNLPPQMLARVVELFGLEGSRVDKLALVFDVRSGEYFEELGQALEHLRDMDVSYRLLFLEAADEALVARYQSTRRPHPLSRGNLAEGIGRERKLLSPLREQADLVVDTTGMTPRELRRRLEETLMAEQLSDQLLVSLESFGYKHGLPDEADMVFDARFLPNPYWVADLRPLTGLMPGVKKYVLARPEAGNFLDQVVGMIRLVAPGFVSEQKQRLVVAVGCTGGRHRSVVLVEDLARRLRAEPTFVVSVSHRDIEREA